LLGTLKIQPWKFPGLLDIEYSFGASWKVESRRMEAGNKRQLPNFQRLPGILKIKVMGSLGTANALSTLNGELKAEG
jgi:hypothetical protein